MKQTHTVVELELRGAPSALAQVSGRTGLVATDLDDARWLLAHPPATDLYVEQVAEAFCQVVEPATGAIAAMVREQQVTAHVALIVHVFDEVTPSLYLPARFLKLLAALDADLDLNVYRYDRDA